MKNSADLGIIAPCNKSLKSMSLKEKVMALFEEQRNYGKLIKISSSDANLVRLKKSADYER